MKLHSFKADQPQTFTKEQYLDWVKRRGDARDWKYYECVAADRCIKQHTLANFRTKLNVLNIPEVLKWYLFDMVYNQFGTTEVDSLMIQLDCYPYWMDRNG